MSGWGVYDVIIEIILNIFQGFMVTWYLQNVLELIEKKGCIHNGNSVYIFISYVTGIFYRF